MIKLIAPAQEAVDFFLTHALTRRYFGMLLEARSAAVDIGDSPLQSFHRMFIDEWLISIATLVVLTSKVAWRGVKNGSAHEAPVLAAMLHQH